MTVSIGEYAKKTVEVDLWDHVFDVVKVTKSSEPQIDEALAAINKKAEKRDLTKHAEQVAVFAERMDVWLKPSPGGKKKASKLILEKWDTNELTLPQIDAFWEGVQAAISRPS